MRILFNHNKSHYKKNFQIPEKIKKRTRDYMESSIEIFEWFNETYEKIENYTINEYITIMDINMELKNSEFYDSLVKNEKRKFTKDKLIKIFKENPLFSRYFREETNTHIDGIKFKAPIRLEGYKKKQILE